MLVGLQKGTIEFSHPEFHKREATLMSSRNALREDFEQVMESMRKGWVDPGERKCVAQDCRGQGGGVICGLVGSG